MAEPDFSGSELASWLQEAGRRRFVRKADRAPVEVVEAAAQPPAAAAPNKPVRVSHPRELCLFAGLALAYLPYFFADVQVQISSLPCIIVFV